MNSTQCYTNLSLFRRDTIKYKDEGLRVKECKEISQVNTNQKKAEVAILDNIDIKIFIFREMGKEGEREGEKHPCVVASHAPTTRDLVHNPGMCPDRESSGNPLVRRSALSLLNHTSQD